MGQGVCACDQNRRHSRSSEPGLIRGEQVELPAGLAGDPVALRAVQGLLTPGHGRMAGQLAAGFPGAPAALPCKSAGFEEPGMDYPHALRFANADLGMDYPHALRAQGNVGLRPDELQLTIGRAVESRLSVFQLALAAAEQKGRLEEKDLLAQTVPGDERLRLEAQLQAAKAMGNGINGRNGHTGHNGNGHASSSGSSLTEVSKFLTGIGLAQYGVPLSEAGYDSVELLKQMSDQELVDDFGVQKGHLLKLRAALKTREDKGSLGGKGGPRRRLPSMSPVEVVMQWVCGINPPRRRKLGNTQEVAKFLSEAGLDEFKDEFQREGYDSIASVQGLTDAELSEDFNMKRGHINKFREGLEIHSMKPAPLDERVPQWRCYAFWGVFLVTAIVTTILLFVYKPWPIWPRIIVLEFMDSHMPYGNTTQPTTTTPERVTTPDDEILVR